MAKFIKHIGRHGDRKVAVVFREVPGEPHMCLVTYTEILNQHVHDSLFQCLESDIGQHSESLADALNRSFTKDGRPLLQVLHAEGQLKKVNTENIIMTPQPNVKIKLSELNKILTEMKQGEDAVKRLAELDKSAGLQDPADVAKRMRSGNSASTQEGSPSGTSSNSSVLENTQLANNLRMQAKRMEVEAKGLIAEAERLIKEASELDGNSILVESAQPVPSVKKRGRTPKVKAAA